MLVTWLHLVTFGGLSQLYGQPLEQYFEQISVRNGLSHNQITSLTQDQYGYVWVGTAHGLNQLDGTEIHTYRMRPDDATSLLANYINRIYESPKAEIWVTFGVGGVSRFDRSDRTFRTYIARRDSLFKPSAVVLDMAWDKENTPWLATTSGLFKYDLQQDSLLPVATEPDSLTSFAYQVFRLFFQGDTLWLGGAQGLWAYHPASGKIERDPAGETSAGILNGIYREGNDRLVSLEGKGIFQLTPKGWKSLNNDTLIEANDFSEGPNGHLWFVNCSDRLYRITKGQIEDVPIEDLPPTCQLVFDAQGQMYGLTPNQRLFFIDPEAGTCRPVRNVNAKAERSGTNSMTFVIKDRDGDLWLGSFERGVYHQHSDRLGFRLYQDLQEVAGSNFITSIDGSQDGKVWLTTRGGLASWDKEEKAFKRVPKRFGQRVVVDREDRIWLANQRGISVIGRDGKYQKNYLESWNRQDWSVSFMTEDREGNIWALHSGGILKIDPTSGESESYWAGDSLINNAHMIRSAHHFYQDKKGDYWIGSVRYGLLKLNPFDEKTGVASIDPYLYPLSRNRNLRSQTVNYITENDQGVLWLGCYSSGLLQFDPETEEFASFPLPNGNVIPNIQGVLEDESGLLWISSSNGLYCFDPGSEQWRRFSEEDGLQSDLFNRGACWKGNDGELYFGGMDGLSIVDPGAISDRDQSGQLYLRDIRINGERFATDQPFEELQSLSLNHNENNLKVNFIYLDHRHAGRLNYAVQLEGLDEGWTSTGNSTVAYRNLPEGDYRLRIRVEVPGQEVTVDEISLRITVHPPFWKTLWFIILMVLLGAFLVGMVIRYRIMVRERKYREIEAIRKKAAEDFHDELGHRLTRISLFAEVLQHRSADEELKVYLEKIKVNSRELYQSMRNFLWALDPEKDSAAELAIVLKDFGDEMFDKTGITFNSDPVAPELGDISLNMDWKRNLLLIFKEAMHNALKHSEAQNVHLGVECQQRQLRVVLRDDGNGLVNGHAKDGFGMRNMSDRATRIKGQLELKSEPGVGTMVAFEGAVPTK